jgi:glutamate synthase (NADPH/NADH) small chain
MPQKMLQFVFRDKEMPGKRNAGDRRQDFAEIYDEFTTEHAAEQAGRCSQCGVPFCQVHCPVQNNIPDWLKLTAEGRLEEAYEVSSATNNFPEICGRICPQDRLCEGNCTIEQSTHGTVTIGAIEKYINETAWANGWVKPRLPNREIGQSVGIIGAGPAGLSAAEMLRAQGYEVHVYDRYDRVGGLMIYGIPNFKLEKEVVERRADLLRQQGIIFHMNCDIGGAVSFDELRGKHDALLIATGVYKARDVMLPGVGLKNVVPALDYLTASNRQGLGDMVPAFESGALNAKGKRVIVIGGGDTAMDCVRTAVRQGAVSVHCLYRRNKANMPGSQREVQNAEEEGVQFEWLAAPLSFSGNEKDEVSSIRSQRMHLGVPDSSGRQTPQPLEGSDFHLPADLVIKALGFDPEDLPNLFDSPHLKVSRWGTVTINFKTMMTSIDGVFAAGDIVRGASLVVWGIRDGRDAATAMDSYLAQKRAVKAETKLSAQAAA